MNIDDYDVAFLRDTGSGSGTVDPYSYGWNASAALLDSDWYRWAYEEQAGQNGKYAPKAWSSNVLNLYQSELANARALQQWQAQNAFDLDMWNLSNEYNSPANQINRLIQAGINPVSGLGSGASGNAQALQSGNSNSVSPIAATEQT